MRKDGGWDEEEQDGGQDEKEQDEGWDGVGMNGTEVGMREVGRKCG